MYDALVVSVGNYYTSALLKTGLENIIMLPFY